MTETQTPKWVLFVGGAFFAAWGLWSFLAAVNLPLDYWDAYDYLVNARYLAGQDLSRLNQAYRFDRPPGISLLVAPVLWLGYAPGQRGTAWMVHLVPWGLGVVGAAVLWRTVKAQVGVALAFLAAAVLVLNPLMLHYLPFVMADVASMTFVLSVLVFSERVASEGRPRDMSVLVVVTALALCTKYPLGAIGLAVPVANALWVLVGEGRPTGLKAKALAVVSPKLAASLVGGLGLAAAIHALIGRVVLKSTGTLWEATTAGVIHSWRQGQGAQPTDPWFELPVALWGTFGAGVIAFAVLGVVAVLVRRDRSGLFHLVWTLGFLAMFAFVIGHKESRYAFPVLPSVAYLCSRGLGFLKRPPLIGVGAAVVLALLAPQAWAEFQRMADPLYTRPSMLAWARFALDRAGMDRAILSGPSIPLFALYPKNPVVLPNDEYWHYHHFNEGGVLWFFDRRLSGVQVRQGPSPAIEHQSGLDLVTVPPTWAQAAGDDAVWFAGYPKGALVLSTAQQWFETNSAAQQFEPPRPFTAADVERLTLSRVVDKEQEARFDGDGFSLTFTRSPAGWVTTLPAGELRLFHWVDGVPTRVVAPLAEAPERLEVIRVTRHEFPVR